MRIGTAVTILPFDNPVRTAEDFAMVDVISNGRLDFGVGRAYQPLEFKNMGLADRQDHSRAEAGGFPVELLNDTGNLILGTPDFAARRMAEVRNDRGQQEVIRWMQVGGLDDVHVRDSMRLFAEEVMPRFKGLPALVPSALREAKVA